MANVSPSINSKAPTLRSQNPNRRSRRPVQRIDSWYDDSELRIASEKKDNQHPASESRDSPLHQTIDRAHNTREDMSTGKQEQFWQNAGSDSSGCSSRDHSPTRQTGIARLTVDRTAAGRTKKNTEARETAKSSKRNATPARANKKAAITASNNSEATSTIDPTIATTEATPADLTATPSSKNKKKNHNNDIQASQQKGRKASRPHEPNTVTPMKKQEYYAGPAFANSPAASSLPIPKFFLRQEAAKAAGDSPRSASASPALHDATTRPRSGLDLLFDADRKEKAVKQHPGSSDTALVNSQQYTTSRPPAQVRQETGHHGGVSEEGWRDYQSQQLKDLIAGKPSTPEARSSAPPTLHQHMSAPPQFQSRMAGSAPDAAAQSDHGQRSHDYYYGNRHLSPMFEAARQGAQSDSDTSVPTQHYRQPASMEQYAARERFSQYSPNPPKTAPYMASAIAQQPDQTMAQHIPTQAAKAQKEDAIRKMLGI